ncbi:GDNF family receptor alpha-like [Trichomycterus rosablanca]|uniref:GDNF family receptor alpha-like n=1 Tax=Trichomycterus rosablanca TaxID=2290929 RepID=UPI002F35574D
MSLSPLSPAPLTINERDVNRLFKKQKVRKAPGPDGISPSTLKHCSNQLAPTFTHIFNRSLELNCSLPSCFKTSTIIPVPKKTNISGLNDYRPVALTSVVMKVFERLILAYLKTITNSLLDPLQFAYRANRSVDDAVNVALHFMLQHLDMLCLLWKTRLSTGCLSQIEACFSSELCKSGMSLLNNICGSEGSSCQMQSSESCNVTIQTILNLSLLSRDCVCAEVDPCNTLQLLASLCYTFSADGEISSAPDKSKEEAQQESSPARDLKNNKLKEEWKASRLLTYVPGPNTSCQDGMKLCLEDEVCNRQLVPFVQSCSPPYCDESRCKLEARGFYSGLPDNVAEMLVFCQCVTDDQDCQDCQVMLNPNSCSQDKSPPWNCLEMLDNCTGNALCRQIFQAFLTKCFGPEVASYVGYSTIELLHVIDPDLLLSEDKECRRAFVDTIGSVLQSRCTCDGLDHPSLVRCNMFQQAIQNRSYFTARKPKQNISSTEVTRSEEDHTRLNDMLWYFMVSTCVVMVVIVIAVTVVLLKRGRKSSSSKKQGSRVIPPDHSAKSLVL